jgi:FMNH2-dependent dimethyl sulfone monooxygenase
MVKIGLYLPVFGGWFRLEEDELPPTYNYMKDIALESERIGIDSLWIPDHMLNPIKGDRAPSLEAWTLAVALAEATEKIIIANSVLCEAFRFPAVLAKMAVTLQEISAGRFWLGVGAGFYQREYEAYGLSFLPHDERVKRTKEAIQLIKKLWTVNEITLNGNYYSVQTATCSPKPIPLPRICYGGTSEASLELVCEEVDCWLMRRGSIGQAQKSVAGLKSRLQREGREQIEIAIPAFVFIRDTDEEARSYVESLTANSKTHRSLIFDSGFVGSPDTIIQSIRQLENAGIDHILFQLSPTLTELSRLPVVLEQLR